MKALTTKEAKNWIASTNFVLTKEGVVRRRGPKEYKFFIKAPEEHREIVYLARSILVFRGGANFSGGLLWLRRWNIGSPQLTWPGWLIIESIRRASGESAQLDSAPAQTFRDDEQVAAHAMLIQTIAFGWVAEFLPSVGHFFHFKDNRQICCVAEDVGTLGELRNHFIEWNPTDEDPMVVRMAEMEKERRAKARQRRTV